MCLGMGIVTALYCRGCGHSATCVVFSATADRTTGTTATPVGTIGTAGPVFEGTPEADAASAGETSIM